MGEITDNTQNYVNVTLAFLGRTTLNGQEAETLVEVQKWLRGLPQRLDRTVPPIADVPAEG